MGMYKSVHGGFWATPPKFPEPSEKSQNWNRVALVPGTMNTGAEIELLDDRDPGVRYPRGVKSSAFAAIARAISDASTFKWSANLAKCSRFCASGASTLIIKNSAASMPSAIVGCYLLEPKHGDCLVANKDDRWTAWWWLGYFGVQTWTIEERKVRIALGMTAMVAFLMIELPLDALFELIGIERHYAAAIAALVSVVLAFFVARPIARILYPDALQKADENSQRRLSKSPCSTS